jgi:hypothetical protein
MFSPEIPYDQFFREVKIKIKQQLEGRLLWRGFSTNDRGNVMEIPITGVGGCHYEIAFHKDCHEIALHFQGSKENNYFRSECFRPYLEKLKSDLGYDVLLESHENTGVRKRLWIKLPLVPRTQELIKQYGDLTAQLILLTYPRLGSILKEENR